MRTPLPLFLFTALNALPLMLPSVAQADAIEIFNGINNNCVVLDTDEAACWGNGPGQSSAYVPTIYPTLSPAESFAFDSNYGCYVDTNGAVGCWGSNYTGQLGTGTTQASILPTTPIGMDSGVIKVAWRGSGACALKVNGDLYCWGANNRGQVGDGTTTTRLSPVWVMSNVIDISTKGGFSCAINTTGNVYCWGVNHYGIDGTAPTSPNYFTSPQLVTGISGATSISVSNDFACALKPDGKVYCWGNNTTYYHLGHPIDNDPLTRYLPAPVHIANDPAVDLTGVVQMDTGIHHSCAILTDGSAQCWGKGTQGQLGDGYLVSNPQHAVSVVGLNEALTQLSAGDTGTCAITESGGVKCWGAGSGGQLGNDSLDDQATPVDAMLYCAEIPGSCP